VSVKIRLKRFGRRNRASWRVNAIDSRTARDGRVIEELGFYDPVVSDPAKQFSINKDRVAFWLGKGAQPSETVRALLVKAGIVPKAKALKPKKKPKAKAEKKA